VTLNYLRMDLLQLQNIIWINITSEFWMPQIMSPSENTVWYKFDWNKANVDIYYLYFSIVHVVIFILFKPTLSVCLSVCQTSTSGTHTHRQYTATYQINNLTTQTSRKVVTALSTKDGTLKMVKQLWPKHVEF